MTSQGINGMEGHEGDPGPCPFPKFHPSQLQRDDEFFMKLAFNQGIMAWNEGEVPIGAVLVQGDELIGSAHNMVELTGDPTAHAEILAITQASRAIGDWRLNGCTLYVTKEPCPMCSGATIMARIDRVVYGVRDPKMGCLGGGTSLHELPGLNHRVEAIGGVMEAECRALLQEFFRKKRGIPPAKVDGTGGEGIE